LEIGRAGDRVKLVTDGAEELRSQFKAMRECIGGPLAVHCRDTAAPP